MGAAVSASAITGIMQGCKASPELTYTPDFFTEDQAKLMSEVAQLIIPTTDTPGAKEAGVPGFIDKILKECFTKQDQDIVLAGLAEFDAAAKSELGDSFLDLDPEKQFSFLKKENEEARKAPREGRTDKQSFVLITRELTLLGFFTSEPGATQVLQYEAVPGSYKGCIPVAEAGNGKTWA